MFDSFQFQYGAIDGQELIDTVAIWETNFNSSMVRLMGGGINRYGIDYLGFQFQYGAIDGSMMMNISLI